MSRLKMPDAHHTKHHIAMYHAPIQSNPQETLMPGDVFKFPLPNSTFVIANLSESINNVDSYQKCRVQRDSANPQKVRACLTI
jgi:hypothetical protein